MIGGVPGTGVTDPYWKNCGGKGADRAGEVRADGNAV
jgi:hypothetical protein